MKKIFICAALFLTPALSYAQSMPTWKSYTVTGNTADIVPSAGTSDSVAAWLAKKIDTNNGVATSLTINSGSISSAVLINGLTADSFLQKTADGILNLPYATYGAPLSGSSLGTGAFSFIAPDPHIQGSMTLTAMAPIIHLTPVNAYSSFDIWADQSGNAQFSTGRSGAGFGFYSSGGTFDFHGTATGNSAQINLYGYGNSTPASIWQDSAGGLYMTPGSTNGSTSIYANGTGGVAVYSSTLQLHGTSGSQLQFFGASSTQHGTIWQDASQNLNVSTSETGADLNLYAAENIVMKSSVIMPIGTPSSSTASCTQGQMASDDNYIYVCTSSSVWKKTALGAM